MDTLRITKDDLNDNNEYIGKQLSYTGNIELDSCLGPVIFDSIVAVGNIIVGNATSIKAHYSISSGGNITSHADIKAETIVAVGNITSGGSIVARYFITACNISARYLIEAGRSITANSITADNITAGRISAGNPTVK